MGSATSTTAYNKQFEQFSPWQAFLSGTCAPLKGLYVLFSTPGNIRWLIAPMLLFLILWGMGLYGIYKGLDSLLLLLPESLHFSSAFLTFLFWILLSLLFSYLLLFTFPLLFAPFFTLIAENSCKRFGLFLSLPKGFFPWVAFQGRLCVSALLDIFFLLLLSFISLVLFPLFFPISFLSSYFVALLLVFEANAYTYECMNMTFKKRWRFFYTYKWFYAGSALSFMFLLFFLPFLNLLFFAGLVAISGEFLQKKQILQKGEGL